MSKYLLIGFLLLTSSVNAQQEISGMVSNTEEGNPVSGIQIWVIGENTYSLTDSLGKYKIIVPEKVKRLLFTSKHIKGNPFLPCIIEPGNHTIIDVQLVPKGTFLSHGGEMKPTAKELRLERKAP